MGKIYDAGDMQKAVNALDDAIAEVEKAKSKLNSISLGSLTGNAQKAMQNQLEKQKQTLNDQLKTLKQSRSIIQSKIKVLS